MNRELPQALKAYNGIESISKAMDIWTYQPDIGPDFNRPGKPTNNVMVESFNGRLRQECLNEH